MAASSVPQSILQEMVNEVARNDGNVAATARALRLPENTLRKRLISAANQNIRPFASLPKLDDVGYLQNQVKQLKKELTRATTTSVDAEVIKRTIIGLKESIEAEGQPTWCIETKTKAGSPGVPSLFISDLHWGEKVVGSQIMGLNSYNIATAQERMKTCVSTAEHLLRIISPKLDYPGLVLLLGGDMISGNIHEELQVTNELNSMPSVLDLYSVLVGVIEHLAKTFRRLFIPCVTGNHGRDTHKTWGKDRHHTSFDWLLYCFLAKRFENDKRIQFYIPDGPDARYRIYDHKYLLTHGDQFRGGDGMIGALGPIIRGDHRKRSRNAQIGLEYDTMCIGHWHQYIHLTRLIVNGSLKGYDEYAYSNNFPFESPQQALWLTHPKYRITYRMPIYVGRGQKVISNDWVSFTK
jgi:transposase-like protein